MNVCKATLAGLLLTLAVLAKTHTTSSWAVIYQGPPERHDSANAMDVDVEGNIFVTGISRDLSSTESDYLTIKYNPLGVRLWERRHSGVSNQAAVATDIKVDPSGNAYVTGYVRSKSSD